MSAGVNQWGLNWGCRGFVLSMIFRQTSIAYIRHVVFLDALLAESQLYVANSLLLSAVTSSWRSYSAGLPVSLSKGGSFLARITSTGVVRSLSAMARSEK